MLLQNICETKPNTLGKLGMKLILIWIIFLIGCEKKHSSITQSETPLKKNPDNILWDYSTIITNRDIRKYKLWSGRVEIFNFTKKFFCNDSLIISFYSEIDQNAENWIHSKSGVWDQNTNNFEAIENVVVINYKGNILKTDTLFYDNKNDKIYSNSNVMFFNNVDTLYGTSFISNVDLSDINIKNATGVSRRSK